MGVGATLGTASAAARDQREALYQGSQSAEHSVLPPSFDGVMNKLLNYMSSVPSVTGI